MRCTRIITAAALLAVSACAGGPGVPSQTPAWDSNQNAQVLDRLSKSAERAAASQETLALIQRARTEPQPSSIDENLLPPELRRPTTADWSGPAEDLAAKIAGNIGYQFRVVGNPPSVKPIVQVSMVDVPAAKALENIGLQIQPDAQVVVDPNVRRVEVRYLGTSAVMKPLKGTSPSLRSKPSISK